MRRRHAPTCPASRADVPVPVPVPLSRRSGISSAGRVPGRRPRDREAGTVTAELAIALLAVTTLLAGLTSVLAVAVVQVQVTDAAAAGARLAARGEGGARVTSVVEQVAGPAARARVAPGGETTTVSVVRVVSLWLPGSPQVSVRARAVAATEWTDGAAP